MTTRQFDELKDYSHSQPTGAYEGKAWKAFYKDTGWTLCWFDKDSLPGYVSNKYRKIIISDR